MAGKKKNSDGSDIFFLLLEFIGTIATAIIVNAKLSDKPKKTREAKSYESTKPKMDVSMLSPKAKYEYRKKEALDCFFWQFPLLYTFLMLFPLAVFIPNFDERDDTFSLVLCIIFGIIIAILTIAFIAIEFASIIEIVDAKKEYVATMPDEERMAKEAKRDKISIVIAFILLFLVTACATYLLCSMVLL